MKILFKSNKKYMLKWIYILFFIFVLGVILGAFYLSLMPDDKTYSIKRYLISYFDEISADINYKDIFKTSLYNNFKIFLILFICAFSKPTSVISCLVIVFKGFFFGFTTASLIRFYSTDGLFLSFSFIPSAFITITSMVFYAAFSIISSNNGIKKDRKKLSSFLILSFCYLTIFCVAAFGDTFITTTFMKIVYSFLA